MRIRSPVLWLALVAMWLALNQTVAPGDVILGALVAWAGVAVLGRLSPPSGGVRRPGTIVTLAGIVLLDIVRSNIDVARIVLTGKRAGTAGFIDIPLDIRRPAGLAALACIITATPGTAWAGYDSATNVVRIHVLDLVDGPALARSIKDRYERRLMEICE
jgi:multicomponent K+:H+ antiporter subunit E